MSGLPSPVRESKEEAPPARQQEDLEQIVTDESIPADNRYAPASGILTPVQQPMPGAQMSDAGMIRPCAGAVHVAGRRCRAYQVARSPRHGSRSARCSSTLIWCGAEACSREHSVGTGHSRPPLERCPGARKRWRLPATIARHLGLAC